MLYILALWVEGEGHIQLNRSTRKFVLFFLHHVADSIHHHQLIFIALKLYKKS